MLGTPRKLIDTGMATLDDGVSESMGDRRGHQTAGPLPILLPRATMSGEIPQCWNPIHAGGDVASYAIPMEPDQFLFARVMQLGVDLVVTAAISYNSLPRRNPR